MFFIFRNYHQEILDRLDSLDDKMYYLYKKTKLNINSKEENMSDNLKNLEAQVAESVSVTNSAILLIQGIAAKLAAAGTDEIKLAALVESLDASEMALAAAVAANTVAEDEEPVDPPASLGETEA